MGKFKTNTIVADSWSALGWRRNALRVLFYEDLLFLDPSLKLFHSAQDAEKLGNKLLDTIDALASGMLDEDQLEQIGNNIYLSGLSPWRIEQFTEVLRGSIKDIYCRDWSPDIELAWNDVLRRASAIVQTANRRRHFGLVQSANKRLEP